ncbi:hypothetical protein ATKI12_0833 [Kitasatospora sp. Ki12]
MLLAGNRAHADREVNSRLICETGLSKPERTRAFFANVQFSGASATRTKAYGHPGSTIGTTIPGSVHLPFTQPTYGRDSHQRPCDN